MLYANGERYEGTWAEDVQHGFGTFSYADGVVYAGTGTRRHCTGRTSYPDASAYSGEWREGLGNGIGTLIPADGTTYVGEWEGDLRHGRGRIAEASGNSYTGDWRYECAMARAGFSTWRAGWVIFSTGCSTVWAQCGFRTARSRRGIGPMACARAVAR